MSDGSDKSSSLITKLRGFRMQKKSPMADRTAATTADVVDSSTEPSPDFNAAANRRKIKPIVDSDSEQDDSGTPATTSSASIDNTNDNSNSSSDFTYKEQQLRFLREAFPGRDMMMLQDILLKHNWDAQSAMTELLDKKRPGTSENKKRRAKRRRTNLDSDDSDFGNEDYNDERVFDSDEDSDVEISDELTADKRRVLEFLQTATPTELRLMGGCSQKRIDTIVESRPFAGWIDLVRKLQGNKHLSTDILNAAQSVLVTRNNVQQLMRKCTALANQMEKAVAAGAGVKDQPAILSPDLRLAGYQMLGLNWLAVMHAQGVNGILADEMGLGKTVQVIAFLAHLKEIGAAKGPHLAVVPSSTLENWSNEFARWCPSLKVFMYYGSTEERLAMRISWSRGGLQGVDVVLTTYSMVTSTPEERKMFRVTQMHYVVFDEAHMLKNMNTQRYKNLVRVKAHNRILLTGTPLQNNLLELMSLLIFVMPTMFTGKTDDLKNLFQKNSKSTTANSDGDGDLPPFERDQIAQAKRIMKPFVLRRLKRDVLRDLPTKVDTTSAITMTQSQADRYRRLVESFRSSDDDAICSDREVSGMSMMMDLRKLSNHPLLLRYHYDESKLVQIAKRLAVDPTYKETKQEYIVEDLTYMSDFQIHRLAREHKCIRTFGLPDETILASGKFQKLDAMLPQMKKDGHRVLIFSQFVIMLDIIEEYLNLRDHKFLRLDGSTPVVIRQQLIDRFVEDDDIFVFILTTKAGGLGINLTAADTVIIHDIDFNPYNDKQAEDRCHRMGQKRPVTIHRFVTRGTIEEGIAQMAHEKLKLEREVTTAEENGPADTKSVVRLLTLALGLDQNRATNLVSPKKQS